MEGPESDLNPWIPTKVTMLRWPRARSAASGSASNMLCLSCFVLFWFGMVQFGLVCLCAFLVVLLIYVHLLVTLYMRLCVCGSTARSNAASAVLQQSPIAFIQEHRLGQRFTSGPFKLLPHCGLRVWHGRRALYQWRWRIRCVRGVRLVQQPRAQKSCRASSLQLSRLLPDPCACPTQSILSLRSTRFIIRSVGCD